MSNKVGRKGTKPEPKQTPADKEEQKAQSPELTDADLDKVSGGAYEFYVSVKGTKQGQFKP
jgi:hypothetical protein